MKFIKNWIHKVISAVGTIMTLVPKLAGVINASKGVFAAFNAVCAANPYVLIIAAIVALVTAFIYLWNNCEEFRQFWIDLWENIKEIAIAVWEALKAFFQAAWEAIKTGVTNAFNAMLNGIKNICGNIYGAVKGGFDKAIGFIKRLASQAFQWGTDFISGIVNGIKSVIGKVGDAVSSVVNKT